MLDNDEIFLIAFLIYTNTNDVTNELAAKHLMSEPVVVKLK